MWSDEIGRTAYQDEVPWEAALCAVWPLHEIRSLEHEAA